VNNGSFTHESRIKEKIKIRALHHKINTVKDLPTKFESTLNFPNTF
jgi:hypothetical protein